MNMNETLHGFSVVYEQALPEIKGRLVRMTHGKTGADLVWLDREDDNMTFGVAFKTIPSDDTGVFHILEHSVLSGSAKYPVKEPFVELLKSSMNTFLNAMTFPDKTMYPFCSRNRQDFLNLLDVYLDAVFHPLSISDPHAFLQEGWHYELDNPDADLTINGVVYNEMKGAYASPDTVLMGKMNALLFPDSCYGYESGGHPDHIPELTYENYLASHGRFYHPSNARIFLDGSIDLDAVLSRLDGVLSAYDRLEMDTAIAMQAPVCIPEHICHYEIGPEEDNAKKAILARGMVFGTFENPEKVLAASMLRTILCGSNESPLIRALLEKGLAEDMEFSPYDSIQQPFAVMVLRNVDGSRRGEIWAAVDEVLRGLIENGMDHKALHAALDSMEFSNREKDMGGIPVGLIYGITSLESWLYDGDPAQNLCREEVFRTLRRGIDEGYFERFLQELLDSPHQATLCMLPSKTLGAEKQAAEAQRLADIKANAGQDWLEQTAADFKAFAARQAQEDSPEAKASLPVLSLSDVEETRVTIPEAVTEAGGITRLHHPIATEGITYLDLYFDLSDLPAQDLTRAAFLCSLLGQVGTESRSALELSAAMDSAFGRFRAGLAVVERSRIPTPYLVVNMALLDSKREQAAALAGEVLLHSSFAEKEPVFNLLRQDRMSLEQAVIHSGNRYAVTRAAASHSAAGALEEQTRGITYLRWLQSAEKAFEAQGDSLCHGLAQLCGQVFSANRVLVSTTGEECPAFVEAVLAQLSGSEKGSRTEYAPMPRRKEGFVIPAEVGFAGKAARDMQGLSPAAWVAGQILTFGHLWTEVRVKGGAYGTGMRAGVNGSTLFYSFRDPNPKGAVAAFDACGDALRQMCDSDETVDRYIISTMSDVDPLLTPRAKGSTATANYLAGKTDAYLQAQRTALLHTTKDDLRTIADHLDALRDISGLCIIGGKNVLDAFGNELDVVENLI